MLHKKFPALIVARRELNDHLRDWRILTPMVLLVVILPFVINYASRELLDFAAGFGAQIPEAQIYPVLLLVVGFFPITVALILALESFVGEKERRSLEPLLNSPLSALQLYSGKFLASLIPPLIASYLCMGVFLIGLYRQGNWLLDGTLVIQVYLLTTVNCLVMISGAVVLSTQTTSMRGANLLSFFIIVPMGLLLQAQSAALVWARGGAIWWVVAGLILIAILLVRTGVAHFNREELIGRDLDSFEIKWGWNIFCSAFRGQARSPMDWYRREIGATLRRLKLPTLIMSLILAAGIGLGIGLARKYAFPPELIDPGALRDGELQSLLGFQFFEVGTIPVVWYHNLRAIVLATALGALSFGVLAMLIMMVPFTLIAYLIATIGGAGVSSLLTALSLVAPHGLLEVPAIVLAGAAILRLGAILVTPSPGRTLGEAWLIGLADWTRVMVALVIPLLLGAAALEVLVTPRVALLAFGN
jgi:hypothetical protein